MKIFNVPGNIQQAAEAQAPGLGKNPMARAGAPISLTSELGAVAAGQSNVFPTIGLQPGFRTGYWIDEVRINIGERGASDVSVSGLPVALSLKFSTGQYALSKAGVPAMLFSQIYGYDEFDVNVVDSAGGVHRDCYTNFRWLLPKPLYMPPGDILQCNVVRDATFASAATMLGASIAYFGRACAPGEAPPVVRNVPWVAYYQHDASLRASNTVDEFRNQFLKPWTIQRLVARYGVLADGSLLDHLVPVYSAYGALPNIAGSGAYVKAKISDTMGYAIVPNMTPMGAIVDPMRASWTFNRAVSAREQLDMNFLTVGDLNVLHAFISAVGYREEAV